MMAQSSVLITGFQVVSGSQLVSDLRFICLKPKFTLDLYAVARCSLTDGNMTSMKKAQAMST